MTKDNYLLLMNYDFFQNKKGSLKASLF